MKMRTLCKSLIVLSTITAPLFAGGLWLEIGNPAANPEAQAKNAVLIARATSCHSPAKTSITATAEGIVNGVRRSIPLKVAPLSTEGIFAITREWPEQGTWVIKLVATNPEYKDFYSGVLVPIDKGPVRWAGIKHYSHAPTDAEVTAALGGAGNDVRASVN
jgi:hypothetical protein